jgi:protein gp37
MGDKSEIEWTDATWTTTYGCTKVSPGCANCYIERTPPYRMQGLKFKRGSIPVQLHHSRLDWPLRWTTPRRIFVNSLSDLFHEDVPAEFIDTVFAVMALTPQHTYQVLTKRPARMREYCSDLETPWRIGTIKRVVEAGRLSVLGVSDTQVPNILRGDQWKPECVPEWPLSNCWLGVTVENQRWADERIPILLDTPAAVRFLSCEPLLGPLNLREYSGGLDWVIVGGESGPKHRRFDPDWARQIVADCRKAGVACFVKQLGGVRPGNRLDDLPEDLRVREWPVVKGVGA